MSSAPQRLWHAQGLKHCLWASWEEGEYFLFNPASGKTHLLNELGKTLLEAMADTPRDSQALTRLFSTPDEAGFTSDLALVEDQLRQLRLVGLAETTR